MRFFRLKFIKFKFSLEHISLQNAKPSKTRENESFWCSAKSQMYVKTSPKRRNKIWILMEHSTNEALFFSEKFSSQHSFPSMAFINSDAIPNDGGFLFYGKKGLRRQNNANAMFGFCCKFHPALKFFNAYILFLGVFVTFNSIFILRIKQNKYDVKTFS